MTPLVLVQIGDVHYPDMAAAGPAIDLKDSGVSPALVRMARPDRLRNSLKELLSVIEKRRKDIVAILICGDLTSRGHIGGYQSCLKHLDDCLQLSDTSCWPPERIHAVPGNHDVNRANCDPAGRDLYKKFEPLEQAWQDIGLPILSTRNTRTTSLISGMHSISMVSLNSCIGCGERRSFPTAVRENMRDIFKPYIDDPTMDGAFELVGEVLDTPAFAEDHITDVVSALTNLPPEQLPVLLAHHNLLPQALVRVEIYTEVINGGLFRSRLTQCKRPVIYCHGHIHKDPIEIVSDAAYPGGRVVSISAPQLLDGFNIIEVHFSRSGTPIGCRVFQYRTADDHGGTTLRPVVRIPLQGPKHAVLCQDERTMAVAERLTKDFVKLDDLRKLLKESGGSGAPSMKTIVQVIQDLHWLDLVDIHDCDETPSVWQVRRIQP
jgi:hypothetical protein